MSETSSAVVRPSLAQRAKSSLKLAFDAISLDKDVYTAIIEAPSPVRSGFWIFTFILVIVAILGMFGQAGNLATLPRLEFIQERIFSFITNNDIYTAWATKNEFLALVVQFGYNLIWFFIRVRGGFPGPIHVVASLFDTVISGLFDWMTYAFLISLIAKWMGGKSRKNAIWGTVALAMTPRLLLAVNIIPGFQFPSVLLRAWIIAAIYQAVRATYQLSRGRAVLVIILTPILGTIFLILSLVIGIVIGVLFSLLFF